MDYFYNLFNRSLCALFSGLFLLANTPTFILPFVDSVNKPTDAITLTTPAEERPRLESVQASDSSEIASSYRSSTPTYAPTYSAPTTTLASTTTASAPSGSYLSFAGHSVPIFISSDTMTESGASAGLYNGRFLYGHNSANVFGALPALGLGAPVSITLNGQTATYAVAYQITLEKSVTQTYMRAITNARFEGVQYTYALMTCAGTSYGNGDASHRTIVFLK